MKSRMLRIIGVVGVALIGLGVAGCHKASDSQVGPKAGPGAGANVGGVPTASEIMQKVNKRKGGLHSDVGDALKEDAIDWGAVEPKAKEYVGLAMLLGQNEPPKGDKASWEAQTKAYSENSQSLYAAVEKKDKDTALAIHGRISQSCMACHRMHKP